jgi:uncharacterized protein (TIGR03118 family)
MNAMKPFVGLTSRRSMLRGGVVGPGLLGAVAGLLLLGTRGVLAEDEATYVQTNLVSNVVGQATTTDPNLQNAWGVANAPNSALWISDNNDGLSTLYDGNGNIIPLVVKIPVPPATTPPAAPTGMVWNPNSGNQFLIPNTQSGAIFIFDTENGTIAGWNPAVSATNAVIIVDNSNGGKNGAVYKGLAFGTNVKGNFLFATNFRAGTVEAYDINFKLTTLDGAFTDPQIPAGFAPFGIANVDGDLFVTYARQNANKDDIVPGPARASSTYSAPMASCCDASLPAASSTRPGASPARPSASAGSAATS